MKEGRKA